MKIPFHTQHCREGYGCAALCSVKLLVEERNQWQSIAERFSKFSAGSGLATHLFDEIDELLSKGHK